MTLDMPGKQKDSKVDHLVALIVLVTPFVEDYLRYDNIHFSAAVCAFFRELR